MNKKLFFIFAFVLSACSHHEVRSRTPSSVIGAHPTELTFDQADVLLSQVSIRGAPKADYSLKVDMFHTEVPGSIQPQRIYLYFGPTPVSGLDYKDFFIPVLKNSGVNGTFIAINDDFDGGLSQKLLTGPAGFDRFLNALFAILKDKKWIGDFNEKLVLLAFGSGADTLDKIGANSSNFFKSNAEAVAFFNGQLSATNAPGVVNLLSQPRIGFKTYVVSLEQNPTNTDAIKRFIASAEAESEVSVEHVSESIDPKKMTQEDLLTVCLPLFLRSLKIDPFITFRCSDSENR